MTSPARVRPGGRPRFRGSLLSVSTFTPSDHGGGHATTAKTYARLDQASEPVKLPAHPHRLNSSSHTDGVRRAEVISKRIRDVTTGENLSSW